MRFAYGREESREVDELKLNGRVELSRSMMRSSVSGAVGGVAAKAGASIRLAMQNKQK